MRRSIILKLKKKHLKRCLKIQTLRRKTETKIYFISIKEKTIRQEKDDNNIQVYNPIRNDSRHV